MSNISDNQSDIESLRQRITRLEAAQASLTAEVDHLRDVKAIPVTTPEPPAAVQTGLYAPSRQPNLDECYFYHTMDIPGYGTQYGEWDLRGAEADYLGHVDLSGKRVLEVGTASGQLCFYMEKMGAEVVGFDLSEQQEWDIVPYYQHNYENEIVSRKAHIRRLNNSWWLSHNAFGSRAKVIYETIYRFPAAAGRFDICTMGSILLHLRDPFLALQKATSNVTESVIVTDIPVHLSDEERKVLVGTKRRLIQFLPDASSGVLNETWWILSEEIIVEFLKILGFPKITISHHKQKYRDVKTQKYIEAPMYTIVGSR